MARKLEVNQRTIYRDIVSLQGMSVPIYGEAGIGYVMRAGYDLPPLMLDVDEVEALVVALSLLGRTGDKGLKAAALSIRSKIASVLPSPAKSPIDQPSLHVSTWGVSEPDHVDVALLRRAIRDERRLSIVYRDDRACITERIIKPIAMIYYVEVINVVAWCELRQAFRQFRADRLRSCVLLDARFTGEGDGLRAAWMKAREAPPVPAGSPA